MLQDLTGCRNYLVTKYKTVSVMEKPDLNASVRFFRLVICLPLFVGRKRDRTVKESGHFAHCGEILRYQVGGEILSKHIGWVRPTAALRCPLMPSHVSCGPGGIGTVSAFSLHPLYCGI